MKNILPRHVGFIPDGNRRWAQSRNLAKEEGYAHGVLPGIELYEICRKLDIEELSIYGFTKDNTHRPSTQANAFRNACCIFAEEIAARGAALLVVGDDESPQYPAALRRFRSRQGVGIKVNFLINYGWDWDLQGLRTDGQIRSREVSRIDLIVRWGGGRRLSGFLPAQSVYADIYVVEQYWPDFEPSHFESALKWFKYQDRTLGG
ncbi:undecaprenyl diphosphate synthase family protein [Nitrosomonas communis]|uniref:Undecaprenyl diphosphate synthase n=1 Tax=Nitrosomonas communis TaxID=44574 RepID=A0A1I4QRG4_9PROT|nr:undecaprenyl diphosphate synthase family protein [Nitrosomonas communis]SFM42283.1 undecaprenyl diphosphate synthase [Nitrosomonas communis]